ncbi:MAG TPA: Uma2 family endonuclease [Myxococcota bacterium]|nr:Uma2 family endonuclease [Myxococcota bacterium]
MVALPLPALAQSTRPPSYADIEALPPNVVGEILGGELVVSPRPKPRHAQASSLLGGLLIPPFRLGRGGPGGWQILDEPELSLGIDRRYDPVVPDLAGWRLETMPHLPTTAQFLVRPDWVCEVLSQSTARRDRMLKLPFYARAGVGYCWLVDPDQELVEVFENLGTEWKLWGVFGGREAVALAPFEAVPLDLGLIWGPPEEPASETPVGDDEKGVEATSP